MLKKWSVVLFSLALLLLVDIDYSVDASKRVDELDLIVFDFDKTITNIHSVNAPEGAVLIKPEGQQAFRELVGYLQSQGKNVAIASYGMKAVILSEMDKIFGESCPFTSENVITPLDVNSSWAEGCHPPLRLNVSKNSMLEILKVRNEVVANNRIVLIDDDSKNIMTAIGAGYMGKFVLPNPKDGMKEIASTIKAWLEYEEVPLEEDSGEISE